MNLKFGIISGMFMPKVKYENLILLFDTGASTPVWCYGEASFRKKFPTAKKWITGSC